MARRLEDETGEAAGMLPSEEYTHVYCYRCKVVIPITWESPEEMASIASEMSDHVGHPCRYTRIKP